MYSFDGQYKIGLKQNLGGASKQTNRAVLLQSVKLERFKREKTRKENLAALRLQSWWKGCVTHLHLSRHNRTKFDELQKQEQQKQKDGQYQLTAYTNLSFMVKVSCMFFRIPVDYDRLVAISQKMLRLSSSKDLHGIFAHDMKLWIYRMKRLLRLCSRSLHMDDVNISIPLRMFEVFTNSKTYYWSDKPDEISYALTTYLVLNGYFSELRELINRRVPSSIEPTDHPRMPFADAAKDLVLKPFQNISNTNMNRELFVFFIKEILCKEMTPQICYFLVPSICSQIPIKSFISAVPDASDSYSIWLLYSFISILESRIEELPSGDVNELAATLKTLLPYYERNRDVSRKKSSTTYFETDSDDSDMEVDIPEVNLNVQDKPKIQKEELKYAKDKCLAFLNGEPLATLVSKTLQDNSNDSTFVYDVCCICYHLMYELRLPIHKSRFLYRLSFNRWFLRSLWFQLCSVKIITGTGKEVSSLKLLSNGINLLEDQRKILPLLEVFAALFKYALFSVYDSDFYGNDIGLQNSLMPFTIQEVVSISEKLRDVTIGLIYMINPDVKTYTSLEMLKPWLYLCQATTQLIKQLYGRDSRRRYCPDNHWLSPKATISQEIIDIKLFLEQEDHKNDNPLFKPGASALNQRGIAILKYIPFTVPFLQRVRIFQRIIQEDKRDTQFDGYPHQGLNISVNRKYLYQDAYDQLSEERVNNLKQVVRVQMKNFQGLDEAGIDGGGVFREFMAQLMQTGFNPKYGFFKTTSQQLLYPNPDAVHAQQDYLKHFHFLGRMLGKIIYESMMVELPLADFFLCKLLNKYNSNVDIYHLETLDPELYKNLFHLKNYNGDVEDLALTFTVVSNELELKVDELKSGGKDIPVTNANKTEYIFLVADYKLNKQIRDHCNAFRAGLSDVINIEWLQMFDHKELQILISGAPVPIDIEDLKKNTVYAGNNYSSENPYIKDFWEVVSSLSDEQKRKFLRFVTSCSRPPLLGFSELHPHFSIQYGGDGNRLPTAGTCMNLLKLPQYEDADILRKKLVYAIEAEAGFELS